MPKPWSNEEIIWLNTNYPKIGKIACAKKLNRSEKSIRAKTWRLNLKQDRNSDFFKDWQNRAATSKIGKKRPEQALVIKKLHKEGKLDKTEQQKIKIGQNTKNWIARNGHPKGFLGGKHTVETKNIISNNSKKSWADLTDIRHSKEYRQFLSDKMSKLQTEGKVRNCYSRARVGKREDLDDKYFRSSWEANYARYLNFLLQNKNIFKWEYESDVFWFEQIKRGIRTYTPDFKIWEKEDSDPYYIEVKGWMDDKSKTKLKRMKKYYPHVKIVLICKKEYYEIRNKLAKLISGWE